MQEAYTRAGLMINKYYYHYYHDYLVGSLECLLLFTPSCCGEYFYYFQRFGFVAMGSEVLFILSSRLPLYSWSGVQLVLSGFSVRLYCFVQAKTLGTVLANFNMCGIMLVLRAVLNMLMRKASPKGRMCFRCLMFSLSGPCEVSILLRFIASWT